jgi:hypothetical protein
MENNEPNWEDLHKGARAAGDDGFEDAFKKAAEEAEAEAKKGADSSDEEKKRKAEQKKQEKKERKENLEELFAMYERLANAEEVEEIFKEFNVSTGSGLEAALKSEYRKLQMKFHPDKFANNSHLKFSKETENIAKTVSQMLLAFYDEAVEKAKRSFGYATARRNRQSVQNGNRDKWNDNIEAARKAEDVFSGDNEEPEQEEAEKKKETGGAESAKDGSAEGPGGSEKNESGKAGAEPGESGAGEKGPEGSEGAKTESSEERGAAGSEREQSESLYEKLAEMRNEYVKAEFENKGKMDGLKEGFKRIFGINIPENDYVKMTRESYEKALDAYRHAKIEELRNKSGSGADIRNEMKDLLMMFKYGEVIDLADAHNDAKLENMKGTAWGKILSVPGRIAKVYNKIPLGIKLGIGVAAFATGSAAFIAGKRILGGVVTGVGLAKGYESLDQKLMQRRAGKEIEAFLDEMESSRDDGINHLNSFLDREITEGNGVVERMQNMLTRRSRGKAAAVAIGGAMAALGVGKLAEGFFNEDAVQAKGIIDYEKFKGIFGLGEHPEPEMAIPPSDSSLGSSFPLEQEVSSGPIAQGLKEAATGAQETGINHLEVASGSGKGIEHSLIEALKQKGVENPGAVAHRMVLEYADNNDLTVDKLSHIKSASFDIEPGGKEGFQIKDLKFDAMKGHVGHVGGAENVGQTATYTETRVPLDGSRISEATEKAFAQEADISDPYPTEKEYMFNRLNEAEGELNAAATRHVSPPSGAFLHDDNFGPKQVTDLHGPDPERVAELAAQKDAYAHAVEQLGAKSGAFKDISGSVMKEISGNNVGTWKQIKDITYGDAMNSPETKVRMLKTFSKFKDVLGEDAIRPLNGGREKVGSMVSRLAKTMADRSI